MSTTASARSTSVPAGARPPLEDASSRSVTWSAAWLWPTSTSRVPAIAIVAAAVSSERTYSQIGSRALAW